jgi:lysyl-tRNA synthetase class I
MDAESVTAALKARVLSEGVEPRTLYWLLRMALTMEETGPRLSDLISIMGRQRVTERLAAAKHALDHLHHHAAIQQ